MIEVPRGVVHIAVEGVYGSVNVALSPQWPPDLKSTLYERRLDVLASEAWLRQRANEAATDPSVDPQTIGSCVTTDPEAFTPSVNGTDPAAVLAKRVCGRCVVRADCLDKALKGPNDLEIGVMAGFTMQELETMRAKQNTQAAARLAIGDVI